MRVAWVAARFAADTRLRAVNCQAGLASPSLKGTPLRDASIRAFRSVGPGLSVAHAVRNASVMTAAAVCADVRRALGRNGEERTGMLSPCAMCALRLATQSGPQAKNRLGCGRS